MKIAFYCQHLLGIGHVTRSLSIVNALAGENEVTYIQGGPPVPLKPKPSVRMVQLAPLLMQENDSQLYDPLGLRSVEEIFAERQIALTDLASQKFDVVVIELYPFGRKKFSREIDHWLTQVLQENTACKIVCSVRDILVEKSDSAERNKKIVKTLKKFFHQIWVHSDSSLIRFEDTFGLASEIESMIRYTGFVAEPQKERTAVRQKKILLSLGGGSVGAELFLAAADLPAIFESHQFHFALGPYTPEAIRAELSAKVSHFGARVQISGLLTNFEEVLGQCQLSISMAGYNTVMNLLNTRTPGLVLTYDANHEQRMRAELLEAKGYLGVLNVGDLTASILAKKVEARLSMPYPAHSPNLSGADYCAHLVKSVSH